MAPYKLYYWPSLPGRGEFPRLVMEVAGVPYEDVSRAALARGDNPIAPILHMRGPDAPGIPAFAPPILVDGDTVVAQAPNVCLYLGMRHGLAPTDTAGLCTANQHLLTLADIVAEAHDTHHPVSTTLRYEDQREAAIEAARLFRTARLPKWLGYLERVAVHADTGWMLGDDLSVVDLALFNVIEGLRWAFPIAMARASAQTPRIVAIHARVRALAAVQSYLSSDRRLAYNADGIFRRYPELDG